MVVCFGGAVGVPLTPAQRAASMLQRQCRLSAASAASRTITRSAFSTSSTSPTSPLSTSQSHLRSRPAAHFTANSLQQTRQSSAWAAAVGVAGNIVSNAFTRAKKTEMTIDPLRVVAKEMKFLIGDVRKLLGSGHPSLDRAAKYYTQAEGKHMRPLIVLLMSRATYLCPKVPQPLPQQQQVPQTLQASAGVDVSISPLNVLSDFNPANAPFTTPDRKSVV